MFSSNWLNPEGQIMLLYEITIVTAQWVSMEILAFIVLRWSFGVVHNRFAKMYISVTPDYLHNEEDAGL